MLHLLLALVTATQPVAALDTITGVPGVDGLSYAGSAGELEIATPHLDGDAVHIDGALDEAVWDSAAVLRSFTQYDPVEGAPASQKTEALVFISRDAVYFGVRAYDDRPEGVRATLAERDNVSRNDDYVRLVLDTFDDQRRAYVFTVNPLGVQQDGLWVEGGGGRRGGGFGDPIDDNPDFIWESGGQIQPWGWSVEVRIPFKSLRFRQLPVQRWGINVLRRIQRNGYQQSWAPITANISNKLAQTGALEGLQDLKTGLFLEVNPVVTARRVGALDEESGQLSHDDPTGDFGLNLTYGLTSNLTLDGTYNPDFSQVEADAGQIVVNERFAVFFPEKRPFFLEGTEIFSLPRQLIYTRSVVNPVAGAKITGKVGSFNLGYLGAVDEVSDADDQVVNLMRLRRDFGGSSTAGLLFTDRTGGGAYNRVGGLDTRLVFAQRNTLSLLGAYSFTGEPDATDAREGSFLYAKLERSGRGFSYEAELEDSQDDFEAGSGFIRRTGVAQLHSTLRYNLYGPSGALLERVGPYAEFQGVWQHPDFWSAGRLQERQLQAGVSLSLRGNISAFLSYTRDRFRFLPSDYEGLFVDPVDQGTDPAAFRPDPALFSGMDGVSLHGFFSPWERVRGSLQLDVKEQPIFDRTLDVPVQPATSWSGNLSLTLLPTRSLRAEVGVRHETLRRKGSGEIFSNATIPRIRAQYQFSRSLFVRWIMEYAAQERQELVDPVTGRRLLGCEDGACEVRAGSDANDMHAEALLSYEPSPGTVFFLGWTRDWDDPRAFGFRDLQPQADGIFVKASYRFRY